MVNNLKHTRLIISEKSILTPKHKAIQFQFGWKKIIITTITTRQIWHKNLFLCRTKKGITNMHLLQIIFGFLLMMIWPDAHFWLLSNWFWCRMEHIEHDTWVESTWVYKIFGILQKENYFKFSIDWSENWKVAQSENPTKLFSHVKWFCHCLLLILDAPLDTTNKKCILNLILCVCVSCQLTAVYHVKIRAFFHFQQNSL